MQGSYVYLWSACDDIWFNQGPVINDGNWHWIVVTYDGAGTVSLYVDTAPVQAVTKFLNAKAISYTTNGDTNSLSSLVSDTKFVGTLQNILFYDYALSPVAAMAVPSTSPTSAPTVAPSYAPTFSPSTAPPTISPTTLSTALVPAIQLPTCPIGWTLHCSCQWTDKRDHAYQGSSPVAVDSLSWDAIYNRITVEGAVVGSLLGSVVTLMVVAALYACTRSVKDFTQRFEYAPIVDREKA
jgi:hypothetical protein